MAQKKRSKATKAVGSKGSRKKVKRQSAKTSPAPTPKASKKKAKKKARKKAKKLSKIEQLERYARQLEKRLRKYEKQRFSGPLKPGEKRRKPPRTELDAIRLKLKTFLERTKEKLEAIEVEDEESDKILATTYRSFENSDFSIDAELRVPIDGNGMVDSVLIDVEDAGPWNNLKDFWIMIGLVVGAEELTGSPTIDKRPQRAWTNPVRGNRAGAAFFTVRETVFRNLEKYGGEVSMAVIRIFWHPDNLRPMRPRR